MRVVLPVHDDEQDARTHHRGEQDPEAQIHHALPVESRATRRAAGELHRHQERRGDEQAVGVRRDDERALEVEQVVVARIAEHPHGEEEDDRRPACQTAPVWSTFFQGSPAMRAPRACQAPESSESTAAATGAQKGESTTLKRPGSIACL